MPTTTSDRVRVVLVNYRSLDDIAARLASDALVDAEVVVVDNASDPDGVVELCGRHGATSVLLRENRGFAAGVNAAWDLISDRPDLPLLLLNPDAELTREALDALLAELDRGWDGVAPLLLEAPGRPQVGCAGGPVRLWSTVAYFLLVSAVVPRIHGLFFTRRQARRGGQAAWLCMACSLLAPDALRRYGRLPEDEIVYAEDVAWGTAATEQGARFLLVPAAEVSHRHGSSGSSAAWTGALERLLVRRLGSRRGRVAVSVVRTGGRLRAARRAARALRGGGV